MFKKGYAEETGFSNIIVKERHSKSLEHLNDVIPAFAGIHLPHIGLLMCKSRAERVFHKSISQEAFSGHKQKTREYDRQIHQSLGEILELGRQSGKCLFTVSRITLNYETLS
jgi:hypothetical protein